MKFFLMIYLVLFLNISYNLFSKKPIQESLIDGQEIYNDFCAQCHLEDGKGVEGIYPPLAKSDFLNDINQTIEQQQGGYQYKSKNKTRSKRMLKLNRFGLLKSKSKTRKGKTEASS